MTDIQLDLIPEERPESTDKIVSLAELPADDKLVGDPPKKDFVDSIRRYGVIFPVVLIAKKKSFTVADGRNRIKAARAAGLDSIPARVYSQEFTLQEVLTILLNEQRRRNIASDFFAIRSLVAKGHSEKEISRATGLQIGQIRSILSLANLEEELLEAFKEGRIATTTAKKLSSLSKTLQSKAIAFLSEEGSLTGADVERLRQVGAQTQIDSLPTALFSTPAAAKVEDSEEALASVHLSKALEVLSDDNPLKLEISALIEKIRA